MYKELFKLLGTYYEILDDLTKRLQDDYEGTTPFQQQEEDRIALSSLLDEYDQLKNKDKKEI